MENVEVDGLRLAYRSAGAGPAVLLLHGWPTSSFLWRNILPPIAQRNRAIAVDLPGFGHSAKPADGYDFPFFDRVLDGLLDALGIEQVALVAHDLGGPVALHWALHRPGRVSRVALLNTLIYPEFDEAVIDFVRTLLDPARRDTLTSPQGLAELIRAGVADGRTVSAEVITAVQAPFDTKQARLALAAAGVGLSLRGFGEIARLLPGWDVPMRIIYGAQDRLLPDIADTVSRLRSDVPQAEITELADCGHFLQEEEPGLVGDLHARFFVAETARVGSSTSSSR